MNQMDIFLTVDVEEWFHTNWFDSDSIIEKYYGGKEPVTDVLDTTQSLIELFDNHNVKSTFFVLGETAVKYPAIIDIIEGSNHEFACHGFFHNKGYSDDNEFHQDVKKFRKDVKADVKGFRFSNFGCTDNRLQMLLKEGFSYDSSVVPCIKIPRWYGEPDAPLVPYKKIIGNGIFIKEFPLSVMPYLRLPGSGGWFLRNISYLWTKFMIKFAVKNLGYGMLYIHPWEISNHNPDFKEIPFHVFRNTGDYTLNGLDKIIKSLLELKCNFLTLSEYLEIDEKGENLFE
ncbi:MAG: DUF3473 domain-containing protein [Euryarchaeota archaeon]|nr:DUF3473 domain-containing protein [Euryarchaeota archaeon]